MRILAIETSCDETATAVVEDGKKILSNVVASSQELHIKTGGIIPERAAREQIKSIIPVIEEALEVSSINNPIKQINAIAVTIGPGLIGSLLVGVETTKTLAYLWDKPIVPVNHLVGHIYANWLGKKIPKFPALALVVSGGHTDLVYMRDHGNIKRIGGTRDDAAGEAFDKIARLLGLPYPGGPAIAASAAKFEAQNPKFKMNLFPRPMIDNNNFDWSFSGLKTAVLRETQNTKLTIKNVERLAGEAQEAIVDCLVSKSVKAAEKYRPKSFLLGGGVAANNRLRDKLYYSLENLSVELQFHVPVVNICTDNAASIGAAAFYNFRPFSWKKISVNPELSIVSK
jgi:N6-L-threonylcarbamoyladenine synthase